MTITPAGIFKVSRPDRNHDYDEYDSFVCVARDAFVARRTHPRTSPENEYPSIWSATLEAWVNPDGERNVWHCWTNDIEALTVVRVGNAAPGSKLGVVCSSFNAG